VEEPKRVKGQSVWTYTRYRGYSVRAARGASSASQ